MEDNMEDINEEKLKEILSNSIKNTMQSEYLKGISVGYLGACKILSKKIKDMHNAKDIHRCINSELKYSEERIKRIVE